MCRRCLDYEYHLFAIKHTPLYTESEINTKISGLIDLMYGGDNHLIYQPEMFRFILSEFFNDANNRHKNS